MNDPCLPYRIALSLLPGVDIALATRLLDAFGSERDILEASEAELKAIPSLGKNIISAQTRYQAIMQGQQEAEYISGVNVVPLWFREDAYPATMASVGSSPVMLYAAGSCKLDSRPIVSIVGTRHATAYSVSFTERLVADLAEALPDVVIVSGLAYGIDVAAHRAALKAGVTTVGIVAHGLATLYPAQHRDVASRMVASGGTILTEYTHAVSPLRPNFLSRNRLIATLADAVVVVESAEKGGALSTVRHARHAGRPVFALPGRVTDVYSLGCNSLISSGAATLLSSADDIIAALGWQRAISRHSSESASPLDGLSDGELAILRVIAADPTADNDVISSVTAIPPHVLMAHMIGLEMKGLVTSVAGNRYQLLIPFDTSINP